MHHLYQEIGQDNGYRARHYGPKKGHTAKPSFWRLCIIDEIVIIRDLKEHLCKSVDMFDALWTLLWSQSSDMLFPPTFGLARNLARVSSYLQDRADYAESIRYCNMNSGNSRNATSPRLRPGCSREDEEYLSNCGAVLCWRKLKRTRQLRQNDGACCDEPEKEVDTICRGAILAYNIKLTASERHLNDVSKMKIMDSLEQQFTFAYGKLPAA
eukprot:549450-Pleurochrysis_carterae.AAC.1